MKYCDRCNVGVANHLNVLFRQIGDDYNNNISKVTKDICDTCFNDLKPVETEGARRYNKAQKMLDGLFE